MATLLLFVLLFFSAALLVMVVYTIDRLNSGEKITSVKAERAAAPLHLWELMNRKRCSKACYMTVGSNERFPG